MGNQQISALFILLYKMTYVKILFIVKLQVINKICYYFYNKNKN